MGRRSHLCFFSLPRLRGLWSISTLRGWIRRSARTMSFPAWGRGRSISVLCLWGGPVLLLSSGCGTCRVCLMGLLRRVLRVPGSRRVISAGSSCVLRLIFRGRFSSSETFHVPSSRFYLWGGILARACCRRSHLPEVRGGRCRRVGSSRRAGNFINCS